MATEAGVRFVPLARLGRTRLGVAPAFVPFQVLMLAGFGLLAYFTVAGHLGETLSFAGSVWVGLVLLLALDLTVLVHEAGHALAAWVLGIPVKAVVLVAYGGATVRGAAPTVRVERLTAAAGPLANLLAAALACAAIVVIGSDNLTAAPLMVVGVFQGLTAATNLLPIPRMDGSRVFGSRAS